MIKFTIIGLFKLDEANHFRDIGFQVDRYIEKTPKSPEEYQNLRDAGWKVDSYFDFSDPVIKMRMG